MSDSLPVQHNHPDTSHEAANEPENISQAETDRRLILRILQGQEDPDLRGHTSDEISTYIEATQQGRICPPNQVSSRLGELEKEGLVHTIVIGTRRDGKQDLLKRLTRRGSSGQVYEFTYKTREAESG